MRNNKKALPTAGVGAKTKHGRRHHWLVAATLQFTCSERDGMGEHHTNITITNDRFFVTANMIGKAQQTVQVQLFELMADPTLKILNVHIDSVNYLGEMSQEEFYTPPPETASEADGASDPAVAATPPVANDAFSTT